jgi:hypothetical protein
MPFLDCAEFTTGSARGWTGWLGLIARVPWPRLRLLQAAGWLELKNQSAGGESRQQE